MDQTVLTMLASFAGALLGATLWGVIRVVLDDRDARIVKNPGPVPFVEPVGTERFPIPSKVVLDAYSGSTVVRATENDDWTEEEQAFPAF